MQGPSSSSWLRERVEVLAQSSSSEELEAAATELAYSDEPEAMAALGQHLRSADFLARLDDLAMPGSSMLHLSRVMRPLIERSSPEVVALCLELAATPDFAQGPDRKSFLLEAMARVVPMQAATVAAFRQANDEGYFGFNARLLADNGSPPALDLLYDMLVDETVDLEERVECIRVTILHRRTRIGILQMAARLLADCADPTIVTAVIESVFDYQPQWFHLHAPMAPSWRTASDEALRFVIELGVKAKRQPVLSDELQEAIDATLETARRLLGSRGP